MGAYLDKPVKEKVSNNFENKFLKCGASSMQGWRVTQEDAHNCILDFDNECSLFAVYDGHGGHEVAEYTAEHLPDFIKQTDAYKKGAFEEALKDAFLGFDALLATDPVIEKLKEIAFSKKKDDQEKPFPNDEDDEVDVKILKKEAKMPLTELIAMYATNELQKAKKALKEKDPNPDSEVTSSSSPSNLNPSSVEDTKSNGDSEPVQNGEIGTEVGSSSSNDDAVSSSSQVNGDIVVAPNHSKFGQSDEGGSSSSAAGGDNFVSTSGDRTSKKRAVIKMYRSLLEDSLESDSDDNDESFRAADANVSSEDENTNEENGNADGEADASGENEGEEEDDDEDDEDDDDDDDDDDEDDDDDDDEDVVLEDSEAIDPQEMRKKEEPGSDSGCTAVVCLVRKEVVYIANAGDSRAVLSRDGQAVDLSIDHKPDDEAELKRIVGAGGEVTWEGRVNGGLNLSRALGDHLYKKAADLDATQQMITALPDIKVEKIDPLHDEFIVLACDGIWNSMSSQEVVDFVRPLINSGEKLSTICEKMFDKCLAPEMHNVLCDGSGSDNMTCIIVQFNKDPKEVGAAVAKRQSDSPLKEEAVVAESFYKGYYSS
ncbi:probable protein phosphatase CG10417 isoform X3 [Rhodnius prolixus]|uniref:probable protein phosphatase CG10417 isoform X3 n=1 Tax=Rhodnius prolixus TaxID=13249 RepID=UPI003D18DEF2